MFKVDVVIASPQYDGDRDLPFSQTGMERSCHAH